MHLTYLKDSFPLGFEMFDVAVSVYTWRSNFRSMPSNLQEPAALTSGNGGSSKMQFPLNSAGRDSTTMCLKDARLAFCKLLLPIGMFFSGSNNAMMLVSDEIELPSTESCGVELPIEIDCKVPSQSLKFFLNSDTVSEATASLSISNDNDLRISKGISEAITSLPKSGMGSRDAVVGV